MRCGMQGAGKLSRGIKLASAHKQHNYTGSALRRSAPADNLLAISLLHHGTRCPHQLLHALALYLEVRTLPVAHLQAPSIPE